MDEKCAWRILGILGYNWARSDVEEACEFLDHPELREDDKDNYHLWAEPYTRRCYCSKVGYTDDGRFYANTLSDEAVKALKRFFPNIRNRFGEPYLGKEE